MGKKSENLGEVSAPHSLLFPPTSYTTAIMCEESIHVFMEQNHETNVKGVCNLIQPLLIIHSQSPVGFTIDTISMLFIYLKVPPT